MSRAQADLFDAVVEDEALEAALGRLMELELAAVEYRRLRRVTREQLERDHPEAVGGDGTASGWLRCGDCGSWSLSRAAVSCGLARICGRRRRRDDCPAPPGPRLGPPKRERARRVQREEELA